MVPMTISEMVPVETDFNRERQISDGLFADTDLRFIECRNSKKTVGYLIEGDWWWFYGMKGDILHHLGLREVQRAETLFTTVMDKRADSA